MARPPALDLVTVNDVPYLDAAFDPLKGYFEATSSKYRRTVSTDTGGAVFGPGPVRIDLDGDGKPNKQLPANIDPDIQGNDTYTVVPHLTTQAGVPVPWPSFTMTLVAGQGPYRLSDFMFGNVPVNPPGGTSTIVDNGDGTLTSSTVTDNGDGTLGGT